MRVVVERKGDAGMTSRFAHRLHYNACYNWLKTKHTFPDIRDGNVVLRWEEHFGLT